MNRKIGILIILVLFSITFISAETYQVNTSIDIKIRTNDTACNITVSSPTSSNLIVNNPMTVSVGYGYANLTFSNTSQLGHYQYFATCGSGSFDVTMNGQDMTTGKAISYIGFILILLFTFGLTVYGSSTIQWKHRRSDDNKIISVNNFRYLKIFLWVMVYFELMFLFGLSYKFFNEANIQGFTEFFNFVYQWFLNLIYPLIIVLIVIVFAIWISNKKLAQNLKLGIYK